MTTQKEILSTKEVAELLSISARTVDRMMKKGILKPYSFYGKKYYKYSEIVKSIEAGKESTEQEEKAAA